MDQGRGSMGGRMLLRCVVVVALILTPSLALSSTAAAKKDDGPMDPADVVGPTFLGMVFIGYLAAFGIGDKTLSALFMDPNFNFILPNATADVKNDNTTVTAEEYGAETPVASPEATPDPEQTPEAPEPEPEPEPEPDMSLPALKPSSSKCGSKRKLDHLPASVSRVMPSGTTTMDNYPIPHPDLSDPDRPVWKDGSMYPRHMIYSEASTGDPDDKLPTVSLEDHAAPSKFKPVKNVILGEANGAVVVPTRKWRYVNELCPEQIEEANREKQKKGGTKLEKIRCPNNPFCKYTLSTSECETPKCNLRGGSGTPALAMYGSHPNLFYIPPDEPPKKTGTQGKRNYDAHGNAGHAPKRMIASRKKK